MVTVLGHSSARADWTARHQTPTHTFHFTETVVSGITTVHIQYDGLELASLSFTIDGNAR
jgi:hypothetical protein